MNTLFIPELENHRIIYIIRNPSADYALQAASSVWKAGGRFVEITLNTTDALSVIKKLSKHVPEGCYLGAGTVLSPEDVKKSYRAGASFIVSPVVTKKLVMEIKRLDLISIAGAYTATEAYNAWKWGTDLIKIFPAMTPEYIRTLRGPFDFMKFVAVGGVNPGNLSDYLKAGAFAAAFGASFFEFKTDGSFDSKKVEEKVKKAAKAKDIKGDSSRSLPSSETKGSE